MPTTRKKIIKTVYKDEEESENEGHDFSDSGSDAVISDQISSSSDAEGNCSSDDDFKKSKTKSKKKFSNASNSSESTLVTAMKNNFAKSFKKPKLKVATECEENVNDTPLFNIKDLSDADKMLPILNLSESDSSDDESEITNKSSIKPKLFQDTPDDYDDKEVKIEYRDVWSNNIQDDSEEIAKKTFLELEKHKSKLEEAKISVQNYNAKNDNLNVSDVKDLLALGEEEILQEHTIKKKIKIKKQDSDSEMEDWEEVKESKAIPQQGLQLIVDFPDACRKTKKLDVEMMMKRKINRVKKEYQVYMHKVHVLCWLGHGNYVSRVLNNQEVLEAALSVVPSKECYPGDRVDIKYVEQITSWYKDKCTIKQDKSENKFKPKAPPLKSILLQQIKARVFSTKKYMVFVFVSMLRSLGLQCRIMFNFVTLPIKPLATELCSLSTKTQEKISENNEENKSKDKQNNQPPKKSKTTKKTSKIPQLDGNYDSFSESDNIMQVDGNDDETSQRTRRQKITKTVMKHSSSEKNIDEESVSPPKRTRKNINANNTEDIKKSPIRKPKDSIKDPKVISEKVVQARKAKNSKTDRPKETSKKSLSLNHLNTEKIEEPSTSKQKSELSDVENSITDSKVISPRKTRSNKTSDKRSSDSRQIVDKPSKPMLNKTTKRGPKIVITNENNDDVSSEYFETNKQETSSLVRKRSRTSEPKSSKDINETNAKKTRTRSAHTTLENKSKYFIESVEKKTVAKSKKENKSEDNKRVSHRDLAKKSTASKNDVTNDLVNIIKGRINEAKSETKSNTGKKTIKQEASDVDSDYLSVESPRSKNAESDDDFKPIKISPKLKTNLKKIDRRVLSTDDEMLLNKIDVWCEVFVEELEEWVPVDVIKGQVHCVNEIYNRATHPVKYVVGWDNNNYLKDLTRRYVPQWNTVTRKQRAEPLWWEKAIQPWLGPKTPRDREENERLDRMQLEAPLPKSISEYKNHPLYALKRHLLKFEAIYPPNAAALGFVRGEPVYARECVYVCRSREIWLKEAKVVKLGEQPYKIVKARPKWDKLSNKLITDKPLEIFGPWQVKDYEPPTAENGIVPRNPYGNVELFKECMLPKGTALIKLPGLNRIAKKLNIDCAPAMTGFDYNGGYCHPVYDGFVVCKEFEQIITQAWLEDQEEQERKEEEKLEARVYGNWRKLIRSLLIKERLKAKYGFEEPSTSQEVNKPKGPRLVVKKK